MINDNEESRETVRLYRLYHMGEGGGIEAVSILEATEHTQASTRAEELLQTASGEVWLDNEMVLIIRRYQQISTCGPQSTNAPVQQPGGERI